MSPKHLEKDKIYDFGHHDLLSANGQIERWFVTKRTNGRNIWVQDGGGDPTRERTTDLHYRNYRYLGPSPDYLSAKSLKAAGFAFSHDQNNQSCPDFCGTWSKSCGDNDGVKYRIDIEVSNAWLTEKDSILLTEEVLYKPSAQFTLGDPPHRTFDVGLRTSSKMKVSEIEAFYELIWTDMYLIHHKPREEQKATSAPSPVMRL